MFKFEKLTVWQKSIDYADQVYLLTRSFPQDERFGLMSQLRRAEVSVAPNIAEGSSRSSNTDFSRFIEIAYGSLMETISQSKIAQRQLFLNESQYDELHKAAEKIARMLSGLRAALQRKSNEDSGRQPLDFHWTLNTQL